MQVLWPYCKHTSCAYHSPLPSIQYIHAHHSLGNPSNYSYMPSSSFYQSSFHQLDCTVVCSCNTSCNDECWLPHSKLTWVYIYPLTMVWLLLWWTNVVLTFCSCRWHIPVGKAEVVLGACTLRQIHLRSQISLLYAISTTFMAKLLYLHSHVCGLGLMIMVHLRWKSTMNP